MPVIVGMLKFRCHQVGFNASDVLIDQLLTLNIMPQDQDKSFTHLENLNSQDLNNKLKLTCKDKLLGNSLRKILNQSLNTLRD